MKNLLLAVTVLTFMNLFFIGEARAEKNFSVSLFHPIQLINDSEDIKGLRVNLIYGVNDDVEGIDIGMINRSDGRQKGLQLGLFNNTADFRGVQIGLVNKAVWLEGWQIGLINMHKEGRRFFPLVNWAF